MRYLHYYNFLISDYITCEKKDKSLISLCFILKYKEQGDFFMRVVLQVVQNASCTIDNKLFSSIGKGFLLLVGFTEGDNEEVINKMIDKIVSLRIFPDENGKTNLGFMDTHGEILCISQFTLYADVSHGRRPSFIEALRPEKATKLYDYTIEYIKKYVPDVKTGVFGADMKIQLLNDGPFTLMIDSKDL
jgi:D-tyrosyl-tRNA(Tyr) deacylase